MDPDTNGPWFFLEWFGSNSRLDLIEFLYLHSNMIFVQNRGVKPLCLVSVVSLKETGGNPIELDQAAHAPVSLSWLRHLKIYNLLASLLKFVTLRVCHAWKLPVVCRDQLMVSLLKRRTNQLSGCRRLFHSLTHSRTHALTHSLTLSLSLCLSRSLRLGRIKYFKYIFVLDSTTTLSTSSRSAIGWSVRSLTFQFQGLKCLRGQTVNPFLVVHVALSMFIYVLVPDKSVQLHHLNNLFWNKMWNWPRASGRPIATPCSIGLVQQ